MNKIFLTPLLLTIGAVQAGSYPAPVQILIDQGVQIQAEFEAPGGLTGYAAEIEGQPLALYLTADNQQVIVGTMLDAQGQDLSEAQLAEHLSSPDLESVWPQLEEADWIREGAADAERVVYVFTDPNCPYCNAFWRATQDHIGDELQVRHIMVGILTSTSMAKAATILAADDSSAALKQHEQRHADGGLDPLEELPLAARQRVAANNELMFRLGAQATPTIFYKDARNKVRQTMGMPQPDTLHDILQQPEQR